MQLCSFLLSGSHSSKPWLMKLGDEFLFSSRISLITQAGHSVKSPTPNLLASYVSNSSRSYLSSRGWLIIPSLHHAQVVRPQAQPPRTCRPPTPQTMFPKPSTLTPLPPPVHFPFKSSSEGPSVGRVHPHSLAPASFHRGDSAGDGPRNWLTADPVQLTARGSINAGVLSPNPRH